MTRAGQWDARAGHGMVAAAVTFNAMLCFVTTRGVHLGRPVIAGAELAILAGALAVVWRRAIADLFVPAVLVGLNLLGLALMAGGMPAKIAVDLAIPAAFALLGYRTSSAEDARRLLLWLAALILVFGLYEMYALASFEHWFHVFDYYVGKGDLDAAQAGDTGTTLAENGVRPEDQGRQLLGGLLGLHRVGSVFLEPVSAGNWAAICAAFVFATRDRSPGGMALFCMGIATGILADARFGIFSAAAIAVFLMTPLWRSRLLVACLPGLAIAGLLVLAGVAHHAVDNSILGRLTGSAQLLDYWGIGQWLGVAPQRLVSADTGYSYVLSYLGLPCALGVWIAACAGVPLRGAAARLFAAISLYLALSLCISVSALSIKTGAALWFALGALQAERAGRRETARPAVQRVSRGVSRGAEAVCRA